MKSACLPALLTLFLLLPVFFLAPAAHAQQSQVPTYFPPNTVSNSNGNVTIDSGPVARRMAEKMARDRNKERQKKIVTESAQLLALAKSLNADIAKSDSDQLSVSVVSEADKIEKLAKSIRSKMSYGY